MHQLDIQPYVGVGLLKFGMKKEDVEKILGPADKSRKSPMSDETVEFRQQSSLQLVYSVPNGELAEISFFPSIPNVKFRDIDIFKTKDGEEVEKYLIEADGNPLEDVGIVLLLNLGISFSGFKHGDEPEERGIALFTKGRMDKHLDSFKPYKPKFQKRKK